MSNNELFTSILGKNAGEKEVLDFIGTRNLTDLYDDPPFRRYVGSTERGIDLLIENEQIIDIQIHVQASTTHAAFSDSLPFNLERNMSAKEVHALLGEPDKFDVVGSKYYSQFELAALTVAYGKSGFIRYLSIRYKPA